MAGDSSKRAWRARSEHGPGNIAPRSHPAVLPTEEHYDARSAHPGTGDNGKPLPWQPGDRHGSVRRIEVRHRLPRHNFV